MFWILEDSQGAPSEFARKEIPRWFFGPPGADPAGDHRWNDRLRRPGGANTEMREKSTTAWEEWFRVSPKMKRMSPWKRTIWHSNHQFSDDCVSFKRGKIETIWYHRVTGCSKMYLVKFLVVPHNPPKFEWSKLTYMIHDHICARVYMGVSNNRGTPKWMVYNGKTLLKWMIWGYHYFRKHLHKLFSFG